MSMLRARLEQARGNFAGRGLQTEIVEPLELLVLCRPGMNREVKTCRNVGLSAAPADARQFDHGAILRRPHPASLA